MKRPCEFRVNAGSLSAQLLLAVDECSIWGGIHITIARSYNPGYSYLVRLAKRLEVTITVILFAFAVFAGAANAHDFEGRGSSSGNVFENAKFSKLDPAGLAAGCSDPCHVGHCHAGHSQFLSGSQPEIAIAACKTVWLASQFLLPQSPHLKAPKQPPRLTEASRPA